MGHSFWVTLALFLLVGVAACDFTNEFRSLDASSVDLFDETEQACVEDNPDGINCKLVVAYANFMLDSFERDDVIDGSSDFGWRKIINDNGKIISGQSGNHVDVQIYDDQKMGPASDGDRAIYNFGRQGSSIHNIYLISKTFNLQSPVVLTDSVVIEFDYLPIELESNEYLKLEVCNDTPENCGVGQNLTIAGLNDSNMWKTEFEIMGGGDNFNGRNHAATDYQTAKVVLFLENFQKNEFIFRFNSRMDNGFIKNNHNKDMEDGVIIDNVRATAYDLVDGIQDEVEEPEDVLDLDPPNIDDLL